MSKGPAQVTLTIDLTVDREAWMNDFGVEPGELNLDVASYVRTALNNLNPALRAGPTKVSDGHR